MLLASDVLVLRETVNTEICGTVLSLEFLSMWNFLCHIREERRLRLRVF